MHPVDEQALARSCKPGFTPTDEQRAVIIAPQQPLVVVAGAGSGKTETMANRVVYAVLSGQVDAEEVLGLTFTRKATHELQERLAKRITSATKKSNRSLLAMPTVATYHSFANSIVREHGLRIGLEPDSTLIGLAGALEIADQVVRSWTGELDGLSLKVQDAAMTVVQLAQQCAEHLQDPADVAAYCQKVLESITHLPLTDKGGDAVPPKDKKIQQVVETLQHRSLLAPMIAEYTRRKRTDRVMDQADLMASAARIALECPDVGEMLREQYRLVLLDEFQDTSSAQLDFLAGLFGANHSVTAVGDPHQSIYTWRGASAANLGNFRLKFRAPEGPEVPKLSLSTSWRNDTSILAVANQVAAPLAAKSNIQVDPLAPKPGARSGVVKTLWCGDETDEAQQVAQWLAERWTLGETTAAVLCRNRAQFDPIAAALTQRGLPFTTVGSGGLLNRPEVTDVLAYLTLLSDPADGSATARVLTSTRYNFGVSDLTAFHRWAVEKSGDRRNAPIVPALCELPDLAWFAQPDQHGVVGPVLTEEGYRRGQRLAADFTYLHKMTRLPLADLCFEIIRVLRLDVELLAAPEAHPVAATAGLEDFIRQVDEYARVVTKPTLGGLVTWLELARQHERGLETSAAADPEAGVADTDRICVLTCHAAKGLEWDFVAYPGLQQGRDSPPDGYGADQRKPGRLPHELRGDRDSLHAWDWKFSHDHATLKEAFATHVEEDKEDLLRSERRLAYVAVTRAKQELLMCGAQWGSGVKPREPGRFLVDAREALAGHDGWVSSGFSDDEDAVDAERPDPEAAAEGPVWPIAVDDARQLRQQAAQLVADADLSTFDDNPWAGQVKQLLKEREAARGQAERVPLPSHLSASTVVALAHDPTAVALQIRRPIPQQPSDAARRGTRFHEWLEARFEARENLLDTVAEATSDDDRWLRTLQRNFLASEWAGRTPLELEVPIEVVVAQVVLRGRIDAVFNTGEGTYQVVDWKTGRPPATAEAKRQAAMQLATYQAAWAKLAGVSLMAVSSAFFYASTGDTVAYAPEETVGLLDQAFAASVSRR